MTMDYRHQAPVFQEGFYPEDMSEQQHTIMCAGSKLAALCRNSTAALVWCATNTNSLLLSRIN